ncbi:hypothetical protein DT073_13365 [Microbacterium sp. ABRD28]|nr:hypothetical protein DT073_13365 [Microbacterium sp. ABRD28]
MLEALSEAAARLGGDTPSETGIEFDRRLAKARRRWDRMSPTERAEWRATYLAAERERHPSVEPKLPRREAENRDLFAVTRVGDWYARRAAEESARVAQERKGQPVTPKPRPPRATPPAPATDRTPAPDEPKKRGKRRRRVGVTAIQLPDGRLIAPIYDDDDL